MTDEWYGCNGCGAFDAGSKSAEMMESDILGDFFDKFDDLSHINGDDILELAEELKVIRTMEDEDMLFCEECKEWNTFSLVSSTED